MYCDFCGIEQPTSVITATETYPVKGEDITISATVRVCNCCHHKLWDEELDSQNLLTAFADYRKRHDLLVPEDIRRIREKYGLSQTAFAKVLGLGDKTVTRYENGSIADPAQNNLILLASQPSDFALLLERNKSKISDADYQTAISALETLRCRFIYQSSQKAYTYNVEGEIKYSLVPNHWGDQNYA